MHAYIVRGANVESFYVSLKIDSGIQRILFILWLLYLSMFLIGGTASSLNDLACMLCHCYCTGRNFNEIIYQKYDHDHGLYVPNK